MNLSKHLIYQYIVVLKASLTCYAGRCFDGHILDMIELGIDRFTSMKDIKVTWLIGLSQTDSTSFKVILQH